MSKTVLEQALDHLLNKEEDKASALLHNYYVSIGRKVYEDIMSDEEMYDQDAAAVADAIDEVDSDLTEEDDEVAPPADSEKAATDDLADELGTDGGEAAPVSADAADVADALMDVEAALAELKKEFEEMASGAHADEPAAEAPAAEAPAAEAPAAEEPKEGIEESLELKKVAAPDNSDKADEKNSPVAGKNPNMARPAPKFAAGSPEGTPSGTSPGKAPPVKDLGGTTKPDLKKVSVKGVKG